MVTNIENGEEIKVTIPAGTLDEEQIAQLQNGEWQKRPVRMRINVVWKGDKITDATLIRAGLSDSE